MAEIADAADRAGDAASDAADRAGDAADEATTSRPFRAAARSGFAVNGLLHVLIGILAIRIATGNGGSGQADQSGALRQIASVPAGVVVLWVLVVGLVALAGWHVVQIVHSRGQELDHPFWHRVTLASKAVVFLAIGLTAFTFARGGSTDSTKSSKTLSARILAAPGGELLLIVIGLAIVGVGVYFVVRGVTAKFRKELDLPGGTIGSAVTVLGFVGFIAKGVALAVVGILFVVAAWTFDPQKATGLDGALQSLAGLPFGRVILFVVGAGVVCYGLYLGARARWGKLE
ncbi:DUF1206 domain-containing protein [Frondihabitans australicus]|uniref:Uncharacterized protein DUF1206 n=1 Tax=Frondihabitans australicus TaxID=386892 RepID=A0A495IDD6_9MICO|nr:DUF1206 domain-containing protein [Frondihabitans australicus]RKR73331.1 uncharacterized protein DUF1206 [Frondihabitans australicus]